MNGRRKCSARNLPNPKRILLDSIKLQPGETNCEWVCSVSFISSHHKTRIPQTKPEQTSRKSAPAGCSTQHWFNYHKAQAANENSAKPTMNPAPATQHNQRDRTSEARQASESHLKRNLAAPCRDDTSPLPRFRQPPPRARGSREASASFFPHQSRVAGQEEVEREARGSGTRVRRGFRGGARGSLWTAPWNTAHAMSFWVSGPLSTRAHGCLWTWCGEARGRRGGTEVWKWDRAVLDAARHDFIVSVVLPWDTSLVYFSEGNS
jgi:hypothetical protein